MNKKNTTETSYEENLEITMTQFIPILFETCSHKMSDKSPGDMAHWTCWKTIENKEYLKEILISDSK